MPALRARARLDIEDLKVIPLSYTSACEKAIRLTILRIRLIDDQDQAFDKLSYRLEVAGQTFVGITTEQGILEHQIPFGATAGKLTLLHKPDDGEPAFFWTIDLEITDLEGSGEVAGAQARLNNLGFFAGEDITGQPDEQTGRALQRFQIRFKVAGKNGALDTGGNLTRLTSDVLKEIYGS